MKLGISGISLIILTGCASTPVMQPKVAPLPAQAETKSPCWDSMKSSLASAAATVGEQYEESKEDGTIKDAKEAAKKAGEALYDKASEYYNKVKE